MAFSLKERNIYRYTNGSKEVAADPLVIQRRMAQDPDFDAETDLKLLSQVSNPDECLKAFERLVTAGRRAFGVGEFREENGVQTGLLDEEVCELLADFSSWQLELKKNIVTSQEQQNSTEQASSNGEKSPLLMNSSLVSS
jgi:hypothetical protein